MSPRLVRVAIVLLGLAGAAVAGYLTWVHYRPEALVCVGGGGCETVQRSRWAELGPVPVAVLGLAAYVWIVASGLARGLLAAAAGASVALGGLVFAAWLVYVQAVLVGAWCAWCLASDAILTLLTVVAVWRVFVEAEAA